MIPSGVEHILPLYLAVGVAVGGIILRLVGGRGRRAFTWMRLLALIVLLSILARPYWEVAREAGEVQAAAPIRILIDTSESVDQKVLRSELEAVLKELDQEDRPYEIIPFAGVTGSSVESVSAAFGQASRLSEGETNLEGMLQEMLASPSRDLVLITDGLETRGSARSVIAALREKNIRLFPQVRKDLKRREEGVVLDNLLLPLHREKGDAVEGSVTLASRSKNRESGTVSLYINGELVSEEEVTLEPEGSVVRPLSVPPTTRDRDEVEVRFIPASLQGKPVSRTWYLHSRPGERVLLLGESAGENRYLMNLFQQMKVQVDGGMSASGEKSLSQYRAILLNNIRHKAIPAQVRDEIAEYVRAGGDLVVIGGERSFGLGGYVGTEIDALLPVESLIPRKELKRVNVAVQLVLDKSASMKYGQKMDFSKQAAREVVRNLKDADYFGVIGFDTTPFIAFPLRRLAEYRNMAIQRIATLYAAGKTNLYPALDEARRGLVNTPAGRKHAIVLTDGQIPDAGPQYLQLVQQMRMRGITVSTVMMGVDADTSLLRSMAQYGGGSFYQTGDASALPRIFLSDVQVSTREDTMKETKEYTVRRRTDRGAEAFSVSLQQYPPLEGYVSTKPRRSEYVELLVTGGGKAEPLLATRAVGGGRTVAVTTDMTGRWSSQWIAWKSFRRFWEELLFPELKAGEARESGDEPDYDLRWFFDGAELVVDTVLYEERAVLTELSLTENSGEVKSFVPKQVAEGRYQVRLAKDIWSSAPLSVSGRVGEKKFGPIMIQPGGGARDELRSEPVQIEMLSDLARGTGGGVNVLPEKILGQASRTEQGKVRRYETEFLLLVALLLLLIDIVSRALPPLRFSGLKRFFSPRQAGIVRGGSPRRFT